MASETTSPAPLTNEMVKEILRKANAGWFDIEEIEHENGTATLGSREFGDVGDEEPGIKDIEAARRIRAVVQSDYPQFKTKAEVVDEWVMVNILPATS